MKNALLLVVMVGATACGGSQPAPATPSSQSNNSNTSASAGATNAQGTDTPNRALNKTECQQLGEYIAGVCHDTHTRETRIEGWCSDMVERTSAGSWADDCAKSLTYMDSVCFRSTDNAPAMMVCDRTGSQ